MQEKSGSLVGIGSGLTMTHREYSQSGRSSNRSGEEHANVYTNKKDD